ncbi:MAG: hypothetical protein IPJ31_05345 [Bacteroidetes bacterium]|nr:hypothetical protein [Bacteroidota bacterium]MBP6315559.1 hypothetical protein [Chitinophagaceae bacterium]
MRKLQLIFAMLLLVSKAGAQIDLKSTTAMLQECLQLNAGSTPTLFSLFEQSGMMEYKQTNLIQRIKLSDLHSITVNANISGYSVDMNCFEENLCINFIKNDTSNSSLKGTAIQFTELILANTFADNLGNLVNHFKTTEPPLIKTLFKTADGNTPVLGGKRPPKIPTPPAVKKVEPKEEIDKDEVEKEEAVQPVPEKKSNARSKRAEKKEKEEEEEEPKEVRKSPTRKSVKKEEKEEESDAEEKTSPREKRKAARKEAAEEEEEKNGDEDTPSERKKGTRNKLIEDVNDPYADESKSKAGSDFCNQLLAILQSGKENKFKNIEGKLTNADTKINDSKVKLKGARKNYLSWFKKERAFIAELKSSTDYESIVKDFENIQTQLDECLGAGWDMEDKSSSEEYAKLKTEVRDVEFKKESDEAMPTIRVIFLENGGKFTMFMRVK